MRTGIFVADKLCVADEAITVDDPNEGKSEAADPCWCRLCAPEAGIESAGVVAGDKNAVLGRSIDDGVGEIMLAPGWLLTTIDIVTSS